RAVIMARARLGTDRFQRLLAEGRSVALDDAIATIVDAAGNVSPVIAAASQTPDPAVRIDSRYGLTAREQEVMALLARRQSNKEIATALFISPRTVARHVTAIFNKLDVHSRR